MLRFLRLWVLTMIILMVMASTGQLLRMVLAQYVEKFEQRYDAEKYLRICTAARATSTLALKTRATASKG